MMGPHLIWAGVVLVLGVLVARAVRLRWRDLEQLSGGLDGLKHRMGEHARDVEGLFKDMSRLRDAASGDLESQAARLTAIERRLSELEQVVKALSAAGSGAKSAPQRRV